jgi:fatty-acyl-CoA synthase
MSALSYAKGPTTPAIPEGTIGQWLDRAAATFGDRDALVVPFQGVRWSWIELRDRADALARGFASLGLSIGDRVGICAPNCAEWVLTQMATARLGLVLVSINPAYQTYELGHALKLAGVRALVTATRFKSSDYVGMLGELMPASAAAEPGPLFDRAFPELRYVIEIGGATGPARLSFDALLFL